MRLVIITGMSGGGKTAAIRMLEDDGFYCVDNLPVTLIGKFVELITTPDSEITRAAIGIDVRSGLTHIKGAGSALRQAEKEIDALREAGISCEILFMDAEDSVLIKRYKETRRVHPLSGTGRIEDGITREREILEPMRNKANYVVDTSDLQTRDLRQEISRIFREGNSYSSLMVTILSFGFKNGIPTDADLVFDVRFLPNPYYVESLKNLTGQDEPIREFVMKHPDCETFLQKVTDLLHFLLPRYQNEGKYRLVIGVGCTGGQHRSVVIATELRRRLEQLEQDTGFHLAHRDLSRRAW